MLDGQALKKVRENAGLSRGELAEKVHRSQLTVRRWENCQHFPNSHTVMVLATILGCDIETLEVPE